MWSCLCLMSEKHCFSVLFIYIVGNIFYLALSSVCRHRNLIFYHTLMHIYYNSAHSSKLASQPYYACVCCVLEAQHANVSTLRGNQKGSPLLQPISNNSPAGFCGRAVHYCSLSDSQWLSHRWMGYISPSFILIYCNQTALSLTACDKKLSALSEESAPLLRMLSVACLIGFVTHHITPITYKIELTGFLMFTVRLSTCKGKENLNWIINVSSIHIYEFFSSWGVLQMQAKST